jgi:biopolymer transport protein ExbD
VPAFAATLTKGNSMSMNAASLSTSTALAEPMIEMNMTPLIDVMLVLIIMLIITIPRQNHALSLNLPNGGTSEPAKLIVDIDVDFDGTIMWNGLVVANRAALEAKMQAVSAAPERAEVHLRPNKLAAYKVVAGVMAAAQHAGVHNIGLVGNEQFI